MEHGESVWTVGQLLERLDRGDEVFVLDVRNREEFERFRLEGRGPLPTVNLPYFEMLEAGGQADMVDSIVACVERDLAGRLPRDRPILSVCAKGTTATFVTEGLRRLGYPGVTLGGGMTAWGGHYSTRTVLETADLSIHQVSRPARGCLSYVVASGGRATVIDPARHLHPYLELARARGLALERVLDTHGHADHISGGPTLARETGATYHLHPYDAVHPVDLLPATIPYEPMRDGQSFPVGHHRLEVLHAPGHTLGLVALRLDPYLFTGDSIFIRSIARPDLGGKAEAWAPLHARSLRRVAALPGGTIVLPGHFSSLDEANESGVFAAPLAELNRTNDGLLALARESEAGFVRYLLESLPEPISEYVDIKRVNAGLLAPTEEEAARLELGKNVCALAQAYVQADGGER
jgi:glyoxylase-like metal-dependent hydrolase (beta-lactamase superfamily II)/rhodanese-related sulfurtransferase